MTRHQGSYGLPLVECLNARLGKYRIRWDVQTQDAESETVSFVEADFPHKPSPEDVEISIAASGFDATGEELLQIASLLGYDPDEWNSRMESGRKRRVASDPQAQIMMLLRRERMQMTDIPDEEVLETPATFVTFEELCKRGKLLEKGIALRYRNKMWRVVQSHTPQSIYPPGEGTESLYNRIEPGHAGTISDPIPYEKPMVVYADKYYIFNGQLYHCLRDSVEALQYNPPELIGQYFEEAG